jgi:mono/diheme cytochrome c family protein
MSKLRIGWIGIAGALLAMSLATGSGCATNNARRDDLVAAPLNLNDAKLATGRRVFVANCNVCHPGGAAGLGPSLNDRHMLFDFMIARQVRKGRGAMPKFSKQRISDEQLDALVAYLDAMRAQPVQVARNQK